MSVCLNMFVMLCLLPYVCECGPWGLRHCIIVLVCCLCDVMGLGVTVHYVANGVEFLSMLSFFEVVGAPSVEEGSDCCVFVL
jgi:hypothetical protein